MFDARAPGPDYQLVWPADVFRTEAAALLDRGDHLSAGEAELLLEEAFAGEAPRNDLTTVEWPDMPAIANPWGGFGGKDSRARAFLRHLASVADVLPRWSAPRPYWSRRHGLPPAAASPAETGNPFDDPLEPDRTGRFRRDWVRLVVDLLDRGYLDKIAPRDCVDAPQPSPWAALNAETCDRLGLDELWPLRPEQLDCHLLYDLVEVVHDLVARPRSRYYHSYSSCGFHYSDFALPPGRALYRWRVNQLLNRHDLGLQMAGDGEDTGRLVHVAGDDRDELVQRALTSPDPRDRDAVRHAVALFRSRGATREDKRSAAVALARILEDRRDLLKTDLLSKDEGALFEIANRFDVRHRRADQRPDYDEAYLDWVFWWYLATVELTDRLRSRQP